MKYVPIYIALFLVITELASCKTQAVTVDHLPAAEKLNWDSLYSFWISNGMGTCTPMMEIELKKGKCTTHELDVKIFIGNEGIITHIQVLKNNIKCQDPEVIKSLEKCMLETLKTDFVFQSSMKGKVITATVGRNE